MRIDGRWTITMKTPLGAQTATLTLRAEEGALEGVFNCVLGSGEIKDGRWNGGDLSWKVELRLPRPGLAEFTARVEGDAIAGSAKLQSIGSMPFKGERSG